MVSLGLGATGAVASGVQAAQIMTTNNKVDEKAESKDLTSALDRVNVLEGTASALTTSSGAATASVSSICTAVN